MPYVAHEFFFFNDTATTEIYTLSLHDALPISRSSRRSAAYCSSHVPTSQTSRSRAAPRGRRRDRKSTRLNSSHANISYAVFCLKKNNLSERLFEPRLVPALLGDALGLQHIVNV